MKKCSYCGRENEDAATVCGECGTEFKAPEMSPEEEAKLKDPAEALVTVAAFDDFNQAAVLKTRLEGAGIETIIPEEFAMNIFSINKPVEERFTVRVAAKDVAAAKEIMAEGQAEA